MRVRSTDDTVTIRLDQSVREKIIREHEYERSQHDITRRLERRRPDRVQCIRAQHLRTDDVICATEDGVNWHEREHVVANELHPQQPDRYRWVSFIAAPGFNGSGSNAIEPDALVWIKARRP
jgi:hypothetical protein